MRRPHPLLLSTCLFGVVVLQAVAFVVIYRFFVLTTHGQRLDTIALASNTLGAARLGGPVNSVLNAISIVAVAIAAGVAGFIALIRRRVALAVTSVVLIGGANLSAELLKRWLTRPNLGIDEARAAAGNSFPSGHTAIAASVAVAFVLVLPPRVRGVGAVIGSLYAAIVGIATLSAGWHRPSDAIGAFLIVGVWAALAGILLRFLRRRRERVVDAESHKIACASLTVLGLVMLGTAAIGLHITDDVAGVSMEQLSQERLAAAYVGSAAGIIAVSTLMMALILLTVHHVVPRRLEPLSRPKAATTRKAIAS